MPIQLYRGTSDEFRTCCVLGEVKPTRRQFKKWGRNIGTARAMLPELRRREAEEKARIEAARAGREAFGEQKASA